MKWMPAASPSWGRAWCRKGKRISGIPSGSASTAGMTVRRSTTRRNAHTGMRERPLRRTGSRGWNRKTRPFWTGIWRWYHNMVQRKRTGCVPGFRLQRTPGTITRKTGSSQEPYLSIRGNATCSAPS